MFAGVVLDILLCHVVLPTGAFGGYASLTVLWFSENKKQSYTRNIRPMQNFLTQLCHLNTYLPKSTALSCC